MKLAWRVRYLEAPNSCSAKKLFYSGYFARKIDPVICLAGKMKYIMSCWQDEIHLMGDFLKNFMLNGYYCTIKIFRGGREGWWMWRGGAVKDA